MIKSLGEMLQSLRAAEAKRLDARQSNMLRRSARCMIGFVIQHHTDLHAGEPPVRTCRLSCS